MDYWLAEALRQRKVLVCAICYLLVFSTGGSAQSFDRRLRVPTNQPAEFEREPLANAPGGPTMRFFLKDRSGTLSRWAQELEQEIEEKQENRENEEQSFGECRQEETPSFADISRFDARLRDMAEEFRTQQLSFGASSPELFTVISAVQTVASATESQIRKYVGIVFPLGFSDSNSPAPGSGSSVIPLPPAMEQRKMSDSSVGSETQKTILGK
ncbi:MAG: hypothetical protein WA705_25340 [Candidatus Ozemobacteraceae bacterium]